MKRPRLVVLSVITAAVFTFGSARAVPSAPPMHSAAAEWCPENAPAPTGGGTIAMTKDAVIFAIRCIKSRPWEPPDYLLSRHSIGRGYLPALQ